jgi:hypothetical protein
MFDVIIVGDEEVIVIGPPDSYSLKSSALKVEKSRS